jgi:Zn-dependent M28 family amino/carboxypeptidase
VVVSAAALALVGCGEEGDDGAGPGTDAFDEGRAYADVRSQVELGPRPAGSEASARTARFIAGELRAAGVEGVRIQEPHANVVGVVPGAEAGAVVVGAHHDTKDLPGFVGANDGASGVAVVLELARALAAGAPLRGPSVHVALFDAEEARGDRPFEVDGTRGSRQYVEVAEGGGGQGAPPLGDIAAMVLFDLVGDCDLQIPLESNSDPALYELFAQGAEAATGERGPFTGTTGPIGDDHLPFLEEGIPAVDLIDFAFGEGPSPGSYWHTGEDTLDKVCEESLDVVGEAAVEAIPRITGPRPGRQGPPP